MGSNDLKLQYYKVILLSIKRSRKNGIWINAKPILILSFFDLISQRIVNDNKFVFDENLIHTYMEIYKQYEQDKNITPCLYPFYHIRNDGFVNLTFKDFSTKRPHTPSVKYFRENVKYASFDNTLWDLLQDAEARSFFKEVVINYFLISKNK
jgi:putative restriction endonuclease